MPGPVFHGARLVGALDKNRYDFKVINPDPLRSPDRGPTWCREELAGRLVEVSGEAGGALTAAAALVLESQLAASPCAWVSRRESTFFPPDLARAGVDLDALVVVFVASAGEAARSASRLVRSGAFGLVVLDLGRASEIAMPLESRLAGLAREHDAAIVMLTEKDAGAPSVGSMVSLRMEARRVRERGGESRFRLRLTALKDKRRGPGWTHEEVVHGPAGLR